MGFRFRNRIKIAPGVYLNLGKKGVNSLSVGAGPFTTNMNKEGIKHTAGLHGTGLSYETKRSSWGSSSESKSSGKVKVFWFLLGLLILAYLLH